VRTLEPDIVFLDLSLKNGIGLKAVQKMRNQSKPPRVLVTSSQEDALYAGQALAAGAAGYLHRQATPEEIPVALNCLLEGQVYVSPEIARQMCDRAVNGTPSDPFGTLTIREREVFESIGRGCSTQRIANKLGLSKHTIETYRERIRWKIGACDGSDLTFRAIVWVLMNE
jgi:DNA-binding NarL/FixJ family response regulator